MGPREGETQQQHEEHHRLWVKQVLTTLQKHNLFLKPKKCLFEQKEIEFLGIKVNYRQVWMDEHKVQKAQEWPTPKMVTEVRNFLGFTGFYWYFIQGYLNIAWPLLKLTQKAMPWHWEKEQQNVFEELKARMATQPVLRQPDFTKQFYITTNASAYGVGAILLQEGESDPLRPKSSSKLHPIVYYSATFTPTEWNYDIHDRELLAIYKAIKHWQAYLIWTKIPFEVQTDHANLLFWKSPQKLN